jgi:hypothetical protein
VTSPPSWYARQSEALAAWRKVEGEPWRHEPVHEPVWLEISEESWHEALNKLPPVAWKQSRGLDTFIASEMHADGPKGPTAWMFARSFAGCFVTLAQVANYEAMRRKVPRVPGPKKA